MPPLSRALSVWTLQMAEVTLKMPFFARAEAPLLIASCAVYLVSTLLLWAQLFFLPRPNDGAEKARRTPIDWARILLWGGAVFHLASLAGQGPTLFLQRAGVAGLFGWFLIVSYLVGGKRLGAGSGSIVTPVALCAALYSLAAPVHQTWAPNNDLEKFWLATHVFLIIAGYVALSFAFMASLLYFAQEDLLKRKKLRGLWRKLPSLGAADDWIFRATAFGVALLSLGLITGVAFSSAQISNYMPLSDPKVLFSSATWAIFSAYLGARWWLGWHGRRSNLVVVCGFVVLAVSFFGVPHLMPGG